MSSFLFLIVARVNLFILAQVVCIAPHLLGARTLSFDRLCAHAAAILVRARAVIK